MLTRKQYLRQASRKRAERLRQLVRKRRAVEGCTHTIAVRVGTASSWAHDTAEGGTGSARAHRTAEAGAVCEAAATTHKCWRCRLLLVRQSTEDALLASVADAV